MTTFSYSTDAAAKVRAGVLVLPMFHGPTGPLPGPGVKEVGLAQAYRDAKLTGRRQENLLVVRRDGDRFAAGAVLLVGAGDKAELTPNAIRRVLGRVTGTLGRFGTAATTFPQAVGVRDVPAAIQASVEGIVLGAYRFDRYKAEKAEKALTRVTVLGSARGDARAARDAVRRGHVVAQAVCWARDLVNTPAGDMSPAQIAREAQKMARQVGLRCKVWGKPELERGGFGGILGVGAGSVNPPRLIELWYKGAGTETPIALTGKGIAFDSGGLSIKDAKGMETMKCDMGGAASILATMKAIAILKPKINVIAAIPSSENMPSGSATKPGDVLTHRGGTTSEVLNTDAEGRLVLADALAYLAEKKPKVIIDTATLTGACMIALGDQITGAMGNDDALFRAIGAAGDAVGETIWQLPLHDDYRRLIDSTVADVKNIGERYGGAISAAWFLAEFVGDTPWIHLDIAGPAWAGKVSDLGPKGGTGVPVRTLVRYLLDQSV
ncbi:MAG: leucyl aminopeptidase [Actinomycetota bacterium]